MVFKDKYPSAKIHYLAIPKREHVETINSLTKEDLPLRTSQG